MKRFFGVIAAELALLVSGAGAASAAAVQSGDMVILQSSASGFSEERRLPHDVRGTGGFAVRDLGQDSVSEFIIGSGQGAVPSVRVLRADGSLLSAFPAFDAVYRGDVRVAVGDFDGDGKKEIVAATGAGVPAQFRIFASGVQRGAGVTAYGDAFRGGLALAVGDWTGAGKQGIATVPSTGGGPHVRLWDGAGKMTGEFSAFDADTVGDYDIAAGDLDGDHKDELVIVRTEAGEPTVRVLSPERGKVLNEFRAGPKDAAVTVALGDIDGDGKPEILLTGGVPATTFAVDGKGKVKLEIPLGAEGALVRVGVGSFGKGTRLAAASLFAGDAKNDAAKYIEVDVSEQRLRAYEHGKLVKTFLVATGLKSKPTPMGDFSIIERPFKVHYKWSYGAGNPENYDFGWVNWNLRFAPHVYLHYAPWRARFGVRGSHGCVNLSKADAQWMYGWGEVGTPISVQQ